MTHNQAYSLFEKLISIAEKELLDFTLNSSFDVEHKADKSVVTNCDKRIDDRLSEIARGEGFAIVSEEGEHVQQIVESGNYLTIDPIDGTLGYIEYVNAALDKGNINEFLKEDMGAQSDFCLLIGIIENNIPQFGVCYNYITKEKILIDGNDPNNLVRENNVRGYNQKFAVYVDQRKGDYIEDKLTALEDVAVIMQAALGLKSLYTVLNPHEAAVTLHRVQTAGLWDIMPAAVAARAFGGGVFDDLGNPLECDKYIILPGRGATILKGDKFDFVLNELKNPPQS
jgi:fructose-1,6-bisphosphatase/inositol monophosphatase family enzyme